MMLSYLLCQRRIRESLVQRSCEHRINAVERMIGTRALIQAELEFIDVPLEMFLGHLVIDTIDPTLQDGPYTFNPVGVDIAPFTYSFVLCLTV